MPVVLQTDREKTGDCVPYAGQVVDPNTRWSGSETRPTGLTVRGVRNDPPRRRAIVGCAFGPLLLICSVACLGLIPRSPLAAAGDSDDDAAALEFFESKVRPLLVAHCHTCHSAETNSQGGLRVDDRNGLIQGGRRGPAVVPGKAEQSLLLKAVSHTDDKLKMPPEEKLSDEEISILTWDPLESTCRHASLSIL